MLYPNQSFPATVCANNALPNAANVIASFQVKPLQWGAGRISVGLTVAVAPLTGFMIQMQPNESAAWQTLYSANTDYTRPSGVLVGASGDLTTLAVGTGWFIMDIHGMYAVRILAASGGTATLAVDVGG